MSQELRKRAVRGLCTTLLASTPSRSPRSQTVALIVSAFGHLSGIVVFVWWASYAASSVVPPRPSTHIVLLEDQRWPSLRPAVSALPAANRTGPSAAPSGVTPQRASWPALPSPPQVVDIIPPPEQGLASLALAIAEEELRRVTSLLGEALDAYRVNASARVAEKASPTIEELEAGGPTFTPHSVAPQLLNRVEITGMLGRRYPTGLSASGVGGVTMLWMLIDARGKARKAVIHRTSGQVELDALVLKIVSAMRFSPARNNGKPAPVWVQLPVRFEVAAAR
jgi:TonB family protein